MQLQLAREAREARELREAHDLEMALHRSMEERSGAGNTAAESEQALREGIEKSRRAQMLSGLPREKYCSDNPDRQLVECELCLMEYSEGDELLRLPCMHFFHAGCVMPWLQKSQTCPMCQTDICAASQAAQACAGEAEVVDA